MPDVELTCRGRRYFVNTITVEQYKRYVNIMAKNTSDNYGDTMFFDKKIIQELFGNEMSIAEIGTAEVVEFLTAAKIIHFVMQTIVTEKMLNMVDAEPVEKEQSAFDEYDRENGYEDDEPEQEVNQWRTCGEIIDRIVKIAIRLLRNSYSQCMKENVVELLDYLKFELDAISENK